MSSRIEELHALALQSAYQLAKATRMRELKGERRVRTFDSRGLHPYSEEWGRILALEEMDSSLVNRRLGDDGEWAETPLQMRARAERDAQEDFEERLIADRQGPNV